MRENNYSSNLTEKQWSFIESIIEPNTKRKRKHDLRDIFNAILSFQPKTMYLHFYYLSEHKTELHHFMLRFQTIT